MKVFVNPGPLTQTVYAPGEQPIRLRPGECVAGEWYRRYAKDPNNSRDKRPLIETDDSSLIPKAVHDDLNVTNIVQKLNSNPELQLKVEAKQAEIKKRKADRTAE